tara:strand:+ start:3949 stop:4407 length:459 start_codon:yes stop_codon:yes gene_type:complete
MNILYMGLGPITPEYAGNSDGIASPGSGLFNGLGKGLYRSTLVSIVATIAVAAGVACGSSDPPPIYNPIPITRAVEVVPTPTPLTLENIVTPRFITDRSASVEFSPTPTETSTATPTYTPEPTFTSTPTIHPIPLSKSHFLGTNPSELKTPK